MTKVINLRQARKGKARAARRAEVSKRLDPRPVASDAQRGADRHEGHRLVPDPKPNED